jgi:hypothetical protein
MTKPWRELEKLVRDLEQIFAGEQVQVKSPDRIPDKVTGRLREVDVSLRSRIGSVDVLVILECRKRSGKQDATWIEQLATKANDIGASRAVAVSSTPFTAGAIAKATAHNIDLRAFSEVTENVALHWMGGIAYNYEVASIEITVRQSPELGLTSEASVRPTATRIDDMVFVILETGVETSVFELLPLIEVFSEAANTLPLGTKQGFTTTFQSLPGQVGVKTSAGVADVAAIAINVNVERRPAIATAESYQYAGPDGGILADGTQLKLNHYGVPINVNFARHKAAQGQTGFVVRREDSDKDRILAYDFVFVGQGGKPIRTSGVLEPPAPPPAKAKRHRRD